MTLTEVSAMLRLVPGKPPGLSISIVGGGSLAQALTALLPPSYELREIVLRATPKDRAPIVPLARQRRAEIVTLKDALFAADLVWLAVSDSAIAEVARKLAPRTNWKNRIVLHSSGALSSDELAPLRARGASVASVHPMMTFVPGRAPAMAGVIWTVEGDRKAIAAAQRIVRGLGGQALKIKKAHKALYHAFGAFLSPLLVVHLQTAAELARASGIPANVLGALMRPIVEQTLANLLPSLGKKGGPGGAFSGPLVRGDVDTIRTHLEALKSHPGARDLYVALVGKALRSDLPVRNAAAIRKAISPRK